MTRLANTLKQYSAYSACFLALHKGADSQVVYVDIDPDIVLNEGGQAAELDLDQNGTIDFWFHNNSFTFYSESFSSYRLMQNILVGPEIAANAIAGETGLYGTAYGGVYTRYYPFALESGAIINADLNFYNYDLQVMGLVSFFSIGGTGGGYYANWFNVAADETIDKYLGIRFQNAYDSLSFGWIRCDVKDEGRTLIIKDYAYETTPDYPIVAGDTLHYSDVVDTNSDNPVFVYSHNENIYVNLKVSADARISVTNLSGQEIIRYETIELMSTIDMTSVPHGMYIVTVEFKNILYANKVVIY